MGSGASMAAAEALARGELSQYFAGPYLQGKPYEGTAYVARTIGEIATLRYEASDGPIQTWSYAFDLRDLTDASIDDKDFIVIYHYTNELAFKNVGNLAQTAAELFASLVDSRAHFGKGIYGTQYEPCVWGSRLRVLLNNYSNGSPLRDDTDAESQRILQEWGDANPQGHRAAFCIPMLAPKAMAYNIFERQTPDMAQKIVQDRKTNEERRIALGEDYKGRAVDRDRDVWVLRIQDSAGEVQHASAEADGLLELLRLRLAHLREAKGNMDKATLDCIFRACTQAPWPRPAAGTCRESQPRVLGRTSGGVGDGSPRHSQKPVESGAGDQGPRPLG